MEYPRTVTRLSEDARRTIRKRLIGERFKAEKSSLEVRKAAFGRKIYEEAFSEKDIRRMISLPHGWLPRINEVRARFGSEDVSLELMGSDLPVPHEKYYGSNRSNFLVNAVHGSPLASQWDEIHREEVRIAEEEEALNDKIRGVLYSVKTTSALIKAWPEIKDVVQEVCRISDVANLPVPIIGDLNHLLGLRSVTKA